jgi:DNA (cytosine-5)-methyltransferase 1
MKFGSVCSGIEAASAAWEPLGWKSAFFSEIEKFPCSVLAHHYPDTPNFGDMTKFKEWPDAIINVLVGGTPCQSFSVAGLRKGLDDPRGNLMLTFGAIAAKYRPKWLVWENVPGVLSSNGGRDFGTFLGMLAELGYGFAYRILDAQYFGVAQRRRRVFVVAYLGDWRPAAAVLFERHSLSGDIAPSREERQKTTANFDACLDVSLTGALTAGFGKLGAPEIDAYTAIPTRSEIAGTLDTQCGNEKLTTQSAVNNHLIPMVGCWWDGSQVSQTLDAVLYKSQTMPEKGRFPAVLQPVAFPQNMSATQHASAENLSPCLGATNSTAVAFVQNSRDEVRLMGGDGQIVGALAAETGAKQQCYVAQKTVFNINFCDSNGTRSDRPNGGLYVKNISISPTLTLAESSVKIVETAIGWTEELTAHTELQATLQRSGDGGRHEGAMQPDMQVRRLTPIECERLQGFPDNYTQIPHRGKPAADGPRYKALGNSMAVPVMAWIGKRIQMVQEIVQ